MRKSLTWSLVVALSLVGFGCGKEQPAKPETPVVLEATAEIEALLAGADLADGTEDHVVSQCLGCGLVMEGSADHVSHVADYSIHFCSDSCKDNFADDPEGMLMALAVDGEPRTEGQPEAE